MDAMQVTTEMTPCSEPLSELEIPMINTMVTCLGNEHRRLDEQILLLALAATRLASNPGALTMEQAALEVWDEIRLYLFAHIQIEDALVFSWSEDHKALSNSLLEGLKLERREMQRLLAALPASSVEHRKPGTTVDRRTLAQTLLALARTLDLHVARYDGEVLPSIRRSLYQV